MSGARMSSDDALAEARKRFGPQACVWIAGSFSRGAYRVGVLEATRHGAKRKQLGSGLCWERAFLSAEKRANGLTGLGRRAKGEAGPSLFDQGGRA